MTPDALRLVLAGQALIEQPVAVATGAASRLIAEISSADMAITNFEGTLDAPHAWQVKMKTLHIATPAALASLHKLGFNALGLANNHAFDLGPPALAATRHEAQTCGFTTAGSGKNIAAACAPAIVTSKGLRIALFAFDLGPQADMVYAGPDRPGINPLRIRNELVLPADEVARLEAIAKACGYEERFSRRVQVGYSDALSSGSLNFFGITVKTGAQTSEHRYPDPQDLARALQAIQSARTEADLVVVSAHHHHWESNWAAAPEWLKTLGATLVDAGADVVFCHGAPVLQGMEFHRGKPIFYGLGNLIFHTARASRYDNAGIDVWRSAIATCDFSADRAMQSVRMRPIRAGLPLSKSGGADAPVAPELLEGAEADDIISGFLAHSKLDGANVERSDGLCEIYPAKS